MATKAEIKAYITMLKPFYDKLREKAESHLSVYTLNQPCNVTCRKRSIFSKEPFIGGEEFELKTAYQGHEQGIIFVFYRTTGTMNNVVFEFNAPDCVKYLDNFETFFTDIIEDNIAETIESAREVARQEESKDYIKLKEITYGNNFGSW